jgi:DUF971 family protein
VAIDPRTDPVTVAPTADGKRLAIAWRDGHQSEYAPRYLRLRCPCAGCVEEMTGRALLDPARIPPHIFPLEIRHVGRYALGFDWSDGHTTGIYTFEQLRSICPCAACKAAGSAAGP